MSIKNMVASFLSEDGEEAESLDGGQESGVPDGGGLMAQEGGGDEFGDLGSLEEGGDDDGFGDDEFREMDDGGADTDELDHRLEELENEVGSLSSTVNTVRTENEQISDSVEDVEENVRKLLDIYEMVTRGVNPFADDVDAGMAGGMDDEESFGLLADDEDQVDSGGGLDEDIAEADAEGFFDEDLVEEPEDAEPGGDVDEMFPADDDSEDALDAGMDEEDGGKSFQELKDEYEDGDAEWAGEDSLEEAVDAGEGAGEATTGGEATDESAAGGDPPAGTDDDGAGTAALDADSDELADDELFDAVGGESGDETARSDQAEETEPATGASGDTPYLASLGGGFATELIVLEWLEYLTEAASYREATAAIDYYEDIDWIAPGVAAELREYLRGFDDVAGGDGLTIDDHTTSLEYITQLDGGSEAAVALSKLQAGGGGRGLQR